MNKRKTVPMSSEMRERWERARRETINEHTELIELGTRMREASSEDTLSGHLRRAIHRSDRELVDIAGAAGISLLELNEFLSGERTMRSDVLDRLAAAVGFTRMLAQAPASNKPGGTD
jgi:hypothetical protein